MDQSELSDFYNQLIQVVEAMRSEAMDRMGLIEKSIEGTEKQLALLTLSLGEQAALIEGFLTVLPSEKLDEFQEKVKDSRKAMLRAMGEGASAIEGKNSKLATTLAAMADKL